MDQHVFVDIFKTAMLPFSEDEMPLVSVFDTQEIFENIFFMGDGAILFFTTVHIYFIRKCVLH